MSSTHASTEGHQHAHHFNSAVEEFEASKQGMWLFMVTEVLMFGGLFVAYTMFRSMYPEMFHEASHHLAKNLGLTNTIILITSSLTMVLALAAIQRGDQARMRLWLLTTALLGMTFVGGQVYEFTSFVREGLTLRTNLFGTTFYVLTGFHGAHVAIGVLMLLSLFGVSFTGGLGDEASETVELVGLYWHFVDVVWIVIFTVIYLIPTGP